MLAALITFPLVFGWIHFQNPEGDFTRYTAYVFGFPMGVVARDLDNPYLHRWFMRFREHTGHAPQPCIPNSTSAVNICSNADA